MAQTPSPRLTLFAVRVSTFVSHGGTTHSSKTRQVPAANLQVHEIRCGRTSLPRPVPPLPPTSLPQTLTPPDSPNIFTPHPSPAPAPATTTREVGWRGMGHARALEEMAAMQAMIEADSAQSAATAAALAEELAISPSYAMEVGTEAAVMAAAAEAAAAEAEALAATHLSENPPPSDDAYITQQQDGSPSASASEEKSHWARDDLDRTRDRLGGRDAEEGGRGRRRELGAMAQQNETAAGDGVNGIRGAAAAETQPRPPQWACSECTFLNDRRVLSCEMCGTRMPAEERPPDSTYRDILIDDLPLDWERCRREESRRNEEVRTTRVGSGGGGGVGGGPSMSDAAAGSAIGAIGAGFATAMMSSRVRPGRVLASMMQGALVGGVAGAAIGPELRRTTSDSPDRLTRTSRREDPHDPFDRESLYANYNDEYLQQLLEQRLAARSAMPDAAADGDRGGSRHAVTNRPNAGGLLNVNALTGLEATMPRDAPRRVEFTHFVPGPGVILRVRRRVGGHHGGQGGEHAPESEMSQPASAESIASLPEEVLSRESLARMSRDGRQCCICLEEFGNREVVTRLPCLHVYHAACIKSWLQTSGTCPQCKHRVD